MGRLLLLCQAQSESMNPLLLIFIGGGLGSLSRYVLSRALPSSFVTGVPLGTLAANVLASFVVGLFFGYETWRGAGNPAWRMLIVTGFCGGFSTFSTFSNETLTLLKSGQYGWGMANLLMNVGLCLGATFLGLLCFKQS
jgi:CrcB protein